MSDAFLDYAHRALSNVPAKLLGPTKTRAEAKAVYVEIVQHLQACRSVEAVQQILTTHRASILQFHAELDFLWDGDGEDFLGLEREIEAAFEGAEAATFFRNSRPFINGRVCEAGRLPGHSETGIVS